MLGYRVATQLACLKCAKTECKSFAESEDSCAAIFRSAMHHSDQEVRWVGFILKIAYVGRPACGYYSQDWLEYCAFLNCFRFVSLHFACCVSPSRQQMPHPLLIWTSYWNSSRSTGTTNLPDSDTLCSLLSKR